MKTKDIEKDIELAKGFEAFEDVIEPNTQTQQAPGKTISIYIKHDELEKIDNLVWLKKFVIDLGGAYSRNSVIVEAINMLAEKENYNALLKKHQEKINKKSKPQRGRR